MKTPGWISAAEGDRVQALADRRGDGDDEEQGGEGHHDLGQPRDDRVHRAPVVAGHQSHHEPDEDGEERRQHCHLQRGLGAVEQAQEHVPAELRIGAEHEERVLEVALRARIGLGRDPRQRSDRKLRVGIEPAREDLVRAVAEDLRRDRRPDEREHA